MPSPSRGLSTDLSSDPETPFFELNRLDNLQILWFDGDIHPSPEGDKLISIYSHLLESLVGQFQKVVRFEGPHLDAAGVISVCHARTSYPRLNVLFVRNTSMPMIVSHCGSTGEGAHPFSQAIARRLRLMESLVMAR